MAHRNQSIAKHASKFAANLHAIYLTQAEIARAGLDYPVVFARDNDGNIVPIALVGVQPNTNLLCDTNGRWLDGYYVPAYVRRYPFFLARANVSSDDGASREDRGEHEPDNGRRETQEKGQEKELESRSLICVDETALVRDGKVLIDSLGKTTSEWAELEKLIQQLDTNQHSTAGFCARLEMLGLFEKFDADFHPKPIDNASAAVLEKMAAPARINGLLRVNRKSLEGLAEKDLLTLIRDQSIATIEAHLNSLHRFDRLLNLYVASASKMP